MRKVRKFFRRHVLWVCFVGVIIPLTTLVVLQYQSLVKLEKTMPVAHKAYLKRVLWTITEDVKEYYQKNAEQALNLPPSFLARDHFQELREHFQNHQFCGVSAFFVTMFDKSGEEAVYGYCPVSKTLAPVTETEQIVPLKTIYSACTPWKIIPVEQTRSADLHLAVFEKDKSNRIIMNPIVDTNSKVVGVAGLVLDMKYLKENYIPGAIDRAAKKLFPDDEKDFFSFTLRDPKGNVLLETNAGKVRVPEDYLAAPLSFIFTDWTIGIRDCYMSPEEWAHQNFIYNLSLSIFMTAILLGAMLMAFKAAANEMKLSEMKTDFVSNVSHELRTPLSSIRVFGEFMRLGRVRDQEKILEYGEYIENESRRLTQLINNILDFSKIESGRRTYKYEKADIEEMLVETLKSYDVRLKQTGFDVIYEPPSKPLPQAFIDREALSLALSNLIDNAVKYSGLAKEILVRLELRDGYIDLSVTDHGIGIPKADQGKIFEKFYRVSTGLVHDVKGSGLGLAIVKHVVDAHRGKITVDSRPSQGTTFTIHLPVDQTPDNS